MKKFIIAAAIILTTGVLAVITTQQNDLQVTGIAKVSVTFDKNVLGTAD